MWIWRFLFFIEPIQSRCAVLRYSKLRDEQIMMRLMEVVEKENLHTTNDGLEAIIFTAQGDMRQVSDRTVGWTLFSLRSSLVQSKLTPLCNKIRQHTKTCLMFKHYLFRFALLQN